MTSEPTPSNSAATPHQPAERTVALLTAFSERPAWGVRELALKLGYPRSSVHRILQDLATDGYLREDAGEYRVMPMLLHFALQLSQSFRVPRIAAPYVESARDASGETAIMMMYDRGRRQLSGVAAAESLHAIRYSSEASRVFSDVRLGASGKAILAFLPEHEQAAVLDLGGGTAQVPARKPLLKELEKTRERGWARSRSERHSGVRAVAAPVFGAAGTVIGSLLIAWPDNSDRASDEETLGPLARRTADAISAELGASS